jgi:hypothetical protein
MPAPDLSHISTRELCDRLEDMASHFPRKGEHRALMTEAALRLRGFIALGIDPDGEEAAWQDR